MNEKVAALLNDQINKEFYSAYLYLDMANFYARKGLDGFANWYEIQAKEEQDHAMLMYQCTTTMSQRHWKRSQSRIRHTQPSWIR